MNVKKTISLPNSKNGVREGPFFVRESFFGTLTNEHQDRHQTAASSVVASSDVFGSGRSG